MTAGLNTWFEIIREHIGQDDTGGAVVLSGTIIHTHLHGRLDYYPPRTQFAGQQGIETDRTATVVIKPIEITARPDDKVYIIKPVNHPDAFKVFRITGVVRSSIGPGDRRAFYELNVIRTEEVRSGSYSL